MTALRELFAKFDTEFDSAPLVHGAEAVEGLFGKLKGLGTLLVEGAIVGGLVHMVEKTVEAGRALVITSEQVGVSTDALNLWQKGAQLAGVEADDFSMSLRFMQRNAYEASQGGKEQSKAFKDLGINVKDSSGHLKDADTLLRELADGFQKVESPAQRVALAQQLLGRSGSRLLPLLKNGTAGIADMKAELEDLGVGFDTSWTEKAEEAHREQIKLNMVLGSFRTKLAIGVLPIFTRFFQLMVHFTGALNKAVKGTNAIQAVLVALGAVAGVIAVKVLLAFAPLIASTLVWAAAIGIVVLAIDEIITTLEGGDSILRRWIDDTWGVGSTDAAVKALKDAWDALLPALADAWHWLSDNIIPTAKTVSEVMRALGQDIAFVVDQFRHLPSWKDIKDAAGAFLGDIGVRMSGGQPSGDNPNGAKGFGETVTTPQKRGGEGFFGNFAKMAGDASSPGAAAAVPPGFIGPPTAPNGPQVTNQVTVQIQANAKPDPALANHIKGAVQDALDSQNRKIMSGVSGS